MTKAWHADELAALQALLQEQGDTGVDWDGLARQLPRIEGFPVRTGRAVKGQAERSGLFEAPSKRRRTALKNWADKAQYRPESRGTRQRGCADALPVTGHMVAAATSLLTAGS